MNKAMQMWLHGQLAKAWNTWRDKYMSGELDCMLSAEQEALMSHAMHHWMNRLLAAAWNTLRGFAMFSGADARRFKAALNKWLKRAFHASWRTWRHEYMNGELAIQDALYKLNEMEEGNPWLEGLPHCVTDFYREQKFVLTPHLGLKYNFMLHKKENAPKKRMINDTMFVRVIKPVIKKLTP